MIQGRFDNKRLKQVLSLLSIVTVIAAVALAISFNSSAASLSDFRPGRIIDDGVFTNDSSMTASQIQAFLNAKGSGCVNAEAVCLKQYSEGGRVAAQIVYDTAQQFKINPQVFLVLIQKEVGLVTATRPANWQYRTAAGFGCPDTSACNSQYFGFTNQLYQAGRMFRAIMNNSPTWYTPYFVGNNRVYYHPDVGRCGSSTVRIENRATVALYSYTPYQPNQAALNAGYGTGDSCSSHGNRNFFLFFTDWFGSALLPSTLMRSVEDATIYLVADDKKYPISNINTFNALFPLGGVSFVSQTYLDSKTTGTPMGRIVRSADGTVYFFDAGIKLAFSSCGQVADYGYSCANVPLLTDYQISALFNGPMMTNVYKTTSGKRYFITANTKREVYDDASLAENAIYPAANILTETAIEVIPYGTPIIRNNTFLNSRAWGLYAYQNNQLNQIDPELFAGSALSKFTDYPWLDPQSIAKLPAGSGIKGTIKVGDAAYYAIADDGKYRLANPGELKSDFVQVSQIIADLIPGNQTLTGPYMAKSKNSGTIYLLRPDNKRPITSIDTIKLLSGGDGTVLKMSESYLASLATGPYALLPGSLVKTPADGTVYMIDGLSSKITLSTFQPAAELGLQQIVAVYDKDLIDSYTTKSGYLSSIIACRGGQYTAIGSVLYRQPTAYGNALQVDDSTCGIFRYNQSHPGFLLGDDGTIFKLNNAVKQPISAYSTYLQHGGNTANTIRASDFALRTYQTGSTLYE